MMNQERRSVSPGLTVAGGHKADDIEEDDELAQEDDLTSLVVSAG